MDSLCKNTGDLPVDGRVLPRSFIIEYAKRGLYTLCQIVVTELAGCDPVSAFVWVDMRLTARIHDS